jgi:hypothetical protein
MSRDEPLQICESTGREKNFSQRMDTVMLIPDVDEEHSDVVTVHAMARSLQAYV